MAATTGLGGEAVKAESGPRRQPGRARFHVEHISSAHARLYVENAGRDSPGRAPGNPVGAGSTWNTPRRPMAGPTRHESWSTTHKSRVRTITWIPHVTARGVGVPASGLPPFRSVSARCFNDARCRPRRCVFPYRPIGTTQSDSPGPPRPWSRPLGTAREGCSCQTRVGPETVATSRWVGGEAPRGSGPAGRFPFRPIPHSCTNHPLLESRCCSAIPAPVAPGCPQNLCSGR